VLNFSTKDNIMDDFNTMKETDPMEKTKWTVGAIAFLLALPIWMTFGANYILNGVFGIQESALNMLFLGGIIFVITTVAFLFTFGIGYCLMRAFPKIDTKLHHMEFADRH
jgi:hypothetical protein